MEKRDTNENIRTDEDDEKRWAAKLHELCGGIVGSNGEARTGAFLNNVQIELDSEAFEDCVTVEFDCEDAIGLVKSGIHIAMWRNSENSGFHKGVGFCIVRRSPLAFLLACAE